MYFEDVPRYKIHDFLNPQYAFYAHVKVNGVERIEESLEEHTDLCARYFISIVKKRGLDDVFVEIERLMAPELSETAIKVFREMIINTIILHDMGKINPYFQKERLQNDLGISVGNAVNPNHSMLSSIIYMDLFFLRIKHFNPLERGILLDFMVLNAYIISRHHGRLNSLEEFKNQFWIRNGFRGEQGQAVKLLESQRILFEKTYAEPLRLTIKTIQKIFGSLKFHKELLDTDKTVGRVAYVRLVLSLLFACDFYATSQFMDGVEIKDFGTSNGGEEFSRFYQSGKIYKMIREYEKNLYTEYSDLTEVQDINVLRNELFLDAEKELLANLNRDIFYLEAPTGSGKSNVALNLSFKILEEDPRKKKIFYVYPFNTLVEQNLRTLEEHFETSEGVMDLISVINSVEPIKQDKKMLEEVGRSEKRALFYYKKALLNRQFLNYPVILTTHVTLFKYMFGTGKEDVFPFHQLANSVIVLDEIQSYRNQIWGEIITFLSSYAKILNMKIIIMSATLPNLDLLTLGSGSTLQLIRDREKFFSHPMFKTRVYVDYYLLESKNIEKDLFEHIIEKAISGKKILIEFINKSRAREYYNRLSKSKRLNCEVLLMTGDDNIAERERILDLVKETTDGLILVATQVVEAGVDIDMDIGYKNLSLLDSEEQFLGRINRSCKREGRAYFFIMDQANTIYDGDVRVHSEVTLKNEEMRAVLQNKDFFQYYKRIIDILKKVTGAWNELNIRSFYEEAVGKLNFAKIEERMKLIKEMDHQISVYMCTRTNDTNGRTLDGKAIWESYKKLLRDAEMDYAEKRVKLSTIRAQMNYFIYQVKAGPNLIYSDRVGELFFIENGDAYFENGKLNREMFVKGVGEFI